MAKKGKGASKTELILNYKNTHPNAKPKEISAALSKGTTKISPAYVSTILSNSKRGKKKSVTVKRATKKTAARRGPGKRASVTAGAAGVSVDTLLKVKKLADEVGLDNLKTAISAYERLTEA